MTQAIRTRQSPAVPSPLPPFAGSAQLPPFSLAWAAGFLDGEGCIHVARQTYRPTHQRTGRRPAYRLRVCVVQNNLQVLQHFQQGVGVHANLLPVKRSVQHNKQVYTLNYDGRNAMALIALLSPYLVRKRPEAIVAWRFWVDGQAMTRFGGKGVPPDVYRARERLYRKLQSLK